MRHILACLLAKFSKIVVTLTIHKAFQKAVHWEKTLAPSRGSLKILKCLNTVVISVGDCAAPHSANHRGLTRIEARHFSREPTSFLQNYVILLDINIINHKHQPACKIGGCMVVNMVNQRIQNRPFCLCHWLETQVAGPNARTNGCDTTNQK